MELWSQSSGGDETLVKGGALQKVELWSRSSGGDVALVAVFARQLGGSIILEVQPQVLARKPVARRVVHGFQWRW